MFAGPLAFARFAGSSKNDVTINAISVAAAAIDRTLDILVFISLPL
jgi:hypothetical protein